jgi:hypothetical protein
MRFASFRSFEADLGRFGSFEVDFIRFKTVQFPARHHKRRHKLHKNNMETQRLPYSANSSRLLFFSHHLRPKTICHPSVIQKFLQIAQPHHETIFSKLFRCLPNPVKPQILHIAFIYGRWNFRASYATPFRTDRSVSCTLFVSAIIEASPGSLATSAKDGSDVAFFVCRRIGLRFILLSARTSDDKLQHRTLHQNDLYHERARNVHSCGNGGWFEARDELIPIIFHWWKVEAVSFVREIRPLTDFDEVNDLTTIFRVI